MYLNEKEKLPAIKLSCYNVTFSVLFITLLNDKYNPFTNVVDSRHVRQHAISH